MDESSAGPAIGPLARAAVRLVDWYRRRRLGEQFLTDCNFKPTCSAYAREALVRHGFLRGGRLAVARIHRCTDRERIDRIDDPVPR